MALLLLRLALGLVFFTHGFAKVANLTQASEMFGKMGFPGWVGVLIALLEVIGGVLLIIGLFTRIMGLIFAGEMAVAILRVHWAQAPWWQLNSYELALVCGAGSFVLAAFGAGILSIDEAVFHRRR